MPLLFLVFLGMLLCFLLGLYAGFSIHRRPFVQHRDEHGRFDSGKVKARRGSSVPTDRKSEYKIKENSYATGTTDAAADGAASTTDPIGSTDTAGASARNS